MTPATKPRRSHFVYSSTTFRALSFYHFYTITIKPFTFCQRYTKSVYHMSQHANPRDHAYTKCKLHII